MTEAVIMLRKSMDWFLYDNGPRHEIVNINVLRLQTFMFIFWIL